jgi:hypothetical protein
MPDVVLIIGMHRSGTSLLARGMQTLGCRLGERLYEAEPGVNDKGFWEDKDINAFDQRLLERWGSDWSAAIPLPAEWSAWLPLAEAKEDALRLITEKLRAGRPLALKEPRMTILLPFWKDIFRELGLRTAYVHAIRHPLEVAESLRRRDGFLQAHSLYLWSIYNLAALQNASAPSPMVVVNYLQFLHNPQFELERIAGRLGLEAPHAGNPTTRHYLEDFLDPELRHARMDDSAGSASSLLPREVNRLWQSLQALSTDALPEWEPKNLIEDWHSSNWLHRLIADQEKYRLQQRTAMQAFEETLRLKITKHQDREYALRNQYEADLAAWENTYNRLTDELAAMRGSRSWRITRPLRDIQAWRRSLHTEPTKVQQVVQEPIDDVMAPPLPEPAIPIVALQPPLHEEVIITTRNEADFVPLFEHAPLLDPAVRLLAFYLPQFHPFPENDRWWGKGFTEWQNVTRAAPCFVGHDQPRRPAHLGYYDLRVPEIMEEQARLAKNAGISAFSYYFYWFAGKTLMEKPLRDMLGNPRIDLPFCLTWANENWTRRWDGQDDNILIAQEHSDADSLAFIRYLQPYFDDQRYLRIDGRPVLIVYRADIIPDMRHTTTIWREEAQRMGFPDLYLVAAQSFGIEDPSFYGFNAAVEFPPHGAACQDIRETLPQCRTEYVGRVFDYGEMADLALRRPETAYRLFRTALLRWDNTPRRPRHGTVFHHFTRERYRQWLRGIIHHMYRQMLPVQEKLVFINAWNEWAEGSYLEPDEQYGHGLLESTYAAIAPYQSLPMPAPAIKKHDHAWFMLIESEFTKDAENFLSALAAKMHGDWYIYTPDRGTMDVIRTAFPQAHVQLSEGRWDNILSFLDFMDVIAACHYESVAIVRPLSWNLEQYGFKVALSSLDEQVGCVVDDAVPLVDGVDVHALLDKWKNELDIPATDAHLGVPVCFRPQALEPLTRFRAGWMGLEEDALREATLSAWYRLIVCCVRATGYDILRINDSWVEEPV